MEKALLFILSITSFLIAFVHFTFALLAKAKKLTLRDSYIWLITTGISIFIAIIQLVYQVANNITPILPIMALVGLILLGIALIIFINIKNKANK